MISVWMSQGLAKHYNLEMSLHALEEAANKVVDCDVRKMALLVGTRKKAIGQTVQKG